MAKNPFIKASSQEANGKVLSLCSYSIWLDKQGKNVGGHIRDEMVRLAAKLCFLRYWLFDMKIPIIPGSDWLYLKIIHLQNVLETSEQSMFDFSFTKLVFGNF